MAVSGTVISNWLVESTGTELTDCMTETSCEEEAGCWDVWLLPSLFLLDL